MALQVITRGVVKKRGHLWWLDDGREDTAMLPSWAAGYEGKTLVISLEEEEEEVEPILNVNLLKAVVGV